MCGEKVIAYLREHNIKYKSIFHRPAFTAQHTAEVSHISGKLFAKPVLIKVDGRIKMIVVPANYKINFKSLKESFSALDVELVSESEMSEIFSDCEVGAIPPFGNLYGMHVFVSNELAEDSEIYFNAGTHTDLIKMFYKDYEELIHPSVIDVGEK